MIILGFDFSTKMSKTKFFFQPRSREVARLSDPLEKNKKRDKSRRKNKTKAVTQMKSVQLEIARATGSIKSKLPIKLMPKQLTQSKDYTSELVAAINLSAVGKTAIEIVKSDQKVDLTFNKNVDKLWCTGYLLASLHYQGEGFVSEELVVAYASNIVEPAQNATLFGLHQAGQAKARGQIHVEEVAGSALDALLVLLKQCSGAEYPYVNKSYRRIRFDLKNLTVRARVRFAGSQTSVCNACRKFWRKMHVRWDSELKDFTDDVQKSL